MDTRKIRKWVQTLEALSDPNVPQSGYAVALSNEEGTKACQYLNILLDEVERAREKESSYENRIAELIRLKWDMELDLGCLIHALRDIHRGPCLDGCPCGHKAAEVLKRIGDPSFLDWSEDEA